MKMLDNDKHLFVTDENFEFLSLLSALDMFGDSFKILGGT
jgi:hypothetical protein